MSNQTIAIDEYGLKEISGINLQSDQLGKDINDRLAAIDDNFTNILKSDYLRGKPGGNYTSKTIYFSRKQNTNVNENPNLYFPAIKGGILDQGSGLICGKDQNKYINNIANFICEAIYKKHGIQVNTAKWSNDGAFKPITNSDNKIIHWYDNIIEEESTGVGNVFTFITEDNGDKLYAYSSLVYIFIDKRFEYITDSNKDQYKGLIDLSCAIYFTYKNNGDTNYTGEFIAIDSFPTLEYNVDGNFYWKIHGSTTGLLAQGPKGDTATNSLIYCTYSNKNDEQKFVKIDKVLVTYKNESGKEVTEFIGIEDAAEKYIDLSPAKDTYNHVKICAFCVPENTINNKDGIKVDNVVMGTVCYADNITKDSDGNYIVRFDNNLSFNHLFNQHSFFNIMLNNFHNNDIDKTKQGYGLMFIPARDTSNSKDIPAHVMFAKKVYKDDTSTKDDAKSLNIYPITNISLSSNLIGNTDITKPLPDNVVMLSTTCPMNVYYDVNLINRTLNFKTPDLTKKKKNENDEWVKDGSVLNEYDTISKSAQFDISYTPNVLIKDNKNIVKPSLDIDYHWGEQGKTNSEDNTEFKANAVKPNVGLKGLALLLKHEESLQHGVLDFISDLIDKKYVDRWQGANTSKRIKLQYIINGGLQIDPYLNKEVGSTNEGNFNLNTTYCNFNPICRLGKTLEDKSYKISKDSTTENIPYNNIYFYGNIYPYKKRITNITINEDPKVDESEVTYKNYIDMYTYSLASDDKAWSTDFAQYNFIDNSRRLICPTYSLYRDYRSGNSLILKNSNDGSKLYKKEITKAYDSHPLDYNSPGDNPDENIASHEGGVVYPHKIILTDNANEEIYDKNTTLRDLRGGTHKLNRTLKLGRSVGDEKYENYGACIAYINTPNTVGDQSQGIQGYIYNKAFFNGGNAIKFNIKFDKLIAPIINIRSNAYSSPGTDFMRGVYWGNGGVHLTSFNALNTGLAINKVKHSLSYRLVYEIKKGDDVYKGKTNNILIPDTEVEQNIQTGVCGNMRRIFFEDPYSNSGIKKIRENAPMLGQLCDPKMMTRASYPIYFEDYDVQHNLYKRNVSAVYSIDQSLSKIYGLGIHKNNFMYGINGLYGGNISTHNRQLPYGPSLISSLANFNSTSSPANDNGIMDGKNVFKLYSDSKHCTPNDSLYNIGLYHITYSDGNNTKLYTGNDGYRTITLPYYPGECNIIVDSNVFDNIPEDIPSNQQQRIVITPDVRVLGVEIIYNCEVLFDTLLDVISGNALSRNNNWGHASDVWSDNYGSGLDIFITDAIPHSKFLKHNLNSQINRLYAPSKYDKNGSDSQYNHIWDFRPTNKVSIDKSLIDADEECYSGYRGVTYKIANTNSVDHTGSGYIYATSYDLDSYYNRSFINPYYYTTNSPDGITDTLGNLKFNFCTNNELNQNNLLKYEYTGMSLKPIDGKRKLDNSPTNKMFNHPPHFVGVGVIDTNGGDVLYDFINGNHKGIVYLCGKDDTAYSISNTSEYNKYKEWLGDSEFKQKCAEFAILESDIDSNDVINPFRGFNSLLVRNNIDYDRTKKYMSPFFRSFGSKSWCENPGHGTLISKSNSNNDTLYNIYGDDDIQRKDALNIIDFWYPKSTDIFNNPFMFTKSIEIETSNTVDNTNTLPNYTCDNENIGNESPLSNRFNLENIKLAWRKFDIKNNNGYYDGHAVNYGELNDCKLSMLNISSNGQKFTSNVEHIEFLQTNSNINDLTSSYVDILNTKEDNDATDNENTQLSMNNQVDAHICNDGIIWSDDKQNYMAIHLTGNEKKYNGILVDNKYSLAGDNVLPETQLYISKNGTKAAYKIDFTKLLLSAGRYLGDKLSGDVTGDDAGLITDITLDDLIDKN